MPYGWSAQKLEFLMANDDSLTCPLCQGHSRVTRSELIGLLTDHNLRDKIETYLNELIQAGEPVEVGTGQPQSHDFQKDVHGWNPQLAIWRRSPKE
jgi:hypothetical protein